MGKAFIAELKDLGVTDVVRTCEPTYSATEFEENDIRVHEIIVQDGDPPTAEAMEAWNDLIAKRYKTKDPSEVGIIAVHCVAGLGRAPVMAAVALMEVTGIDGLDAVDMIRDKQKGAINARQLVFLQAHKPTTPEAKSCC